ncbi:dienelactone hydrolase [Rhodopseudomonas sp. BR0M22]|nr:dienelactone hydrolase [Rhodopseudomonas sp. BR0M22]
MMACASALVRIAFVAALAILAGVGVASAQQPSAAANPPEPPPSIQPPQIQPQPIHPPPGAQPVQFASFDGVTTLTAYLARPAGDQRRPAVVMLHGCSGLINPRGRFFQLYPAWLSTLVQQGYVVLVVDSASSRGFGQTCSAGEKRRTMLRDRPKDAYAALAYLQAQPFVRADRVALIGWSQGGGTVLLSINDRSIGRPADLKTDFAAAVAFYPGSCSEKLQSAPYTSVPPRGWTSQVPLLVLFGEADVWTELAPCRDFLDAARARGNDIELISYPNAVHAFDAPKLPRTELPQYRAPDGRIPVVGTDQAARADALSRVASFLGRRLAD